MRVSRASSSLKNTIAAWKARDESTEAKRIRS